MKKHPLSYGDREEKGAAAGERDPAVTPAMPHS
jgi:hypothetical protein